MLAVSFLGTAAARAFRGTLPWYVRRLALWGPEDVSTVYRPPSKRLLRDPGPPVGPARLFFCGHRHLILVECRQQRPLNGQGGAKERAQESNAALSKRDTRG